MPASSKGYGWKSPRPRGCDPPWGRGHKPSAACETLSYSPQKTGGGQENSIIRWRGSDNTLAVFPSPPPANRKQGQETPENRSKSLYILELTAGTKHRVCF